MKTFLSEFKHYGFFIEEGIFKGQKYFGFQWGYKGVYFN